MLKIKEVRHFKKYLGLNLFLERRIELFKVIKNKVWNRLKVWKINLFSSCRKGNIYTSNNSRNTLLYYGSLHVAEKS